MATVMLAEPLAKSAVGVKVLRRTFPKPVSALRVPPVTVTSAKEKLVPGSSVNVKQMRLVSPVFKLEAEEVITTLGDVVSTGYKMLSATLTLPKVTLLPGTLFKVLPLRLIAADGIEIPLASSCPARMV